MDLYHGIVASAFERNTALIPPAEVPDKISTTKRVGRRSVLPSGYPAEIACPPLAEHLGEH